MKRIVEYLIAAIFIISALLKLLDFQNTANFISGFSGIGYSTVKPSLILLSSIEMLIGLLFIAKLWENNPAYFGILSLTVFFIIISLFMAFKGYSNCGCFGTQIESYPVISLIKNFLIAAFMIAVKSHNKLIKVVLR